MQQVVSPDKATRFASLRYRFPVVRQCTVSAPKAPGLGQFMELDYYERQHDKKTARLVNTLRQWQKGVQSISILPPDVLMDWITTSRNPQSGYHVYYAQAPKSKRILGIATAYRNYGVNYLDRLLVAPEYKHSQQERRIKHVGLGMLWGALKEALCRENGFGFKAPDEAVGFYHHVLPPVDGKAIRLTVENLNRAAPIDIGKLHHFYLTPDGVAQAVERIESQADYKTLLEKIKAAEDKKPQSDWLF
jgi:hypothetical protein